MPGQWARRKIYRFREKVEISLAQHWCVVTVVTRWGNETEVAGGQIIEKKSHKDAGAAILWRRFSEGAWVWAAAVALLVLISLSRVVIA